MKELKGAFLSQNHKRSQGGSPGDPAPSIEMPPNWGNASPHQNSPGDPAPSIEMPQIRENASPYQNICLLSMCYKKTGTLR